jgi:glycosyltransferase involved in cell wall biosynthesis
MMADMQRVRLIAAEMPAHGWDVEILAPDASFQTDFSRIQGEGVEFPEVALREAHPWCPGLFERIGSRNVGIRASVPVRQLGERLCRDRKYDMVYFSTTQHWLTCQGASWRRKTGIPYVVDLHDPIHLEKKTYFISRHPLKERIATYLGKTIERLALGRADGIVSVSRGYIDDVSRRNPHAPWARRRCAMVEPFPADLEGLEAAVPARPSDGERRRIVYVGAGGNIMERGWMELVGCLQECGNCAWPAIELHGTDTAWRTNRRRYLQETAERAGLRGVVEEFPARISYAQSLSLVKGADGLLVLGVDDANYRPSKLQTYLATGLPVLVLLHEDSALAGEMSEAGRGVHTMIFGPAADRRAANLAALQGFRAEVAAGMRCSPGQRSLLSPASSAEHHAELFEDVVRKARIAAPGEKN